MIHFAFMSTKISISLQKLLEDLKKESILNISLIHCIRDEIYINFNTDLLFVWLIVLLLSLKLIIVLVVLINLKFVKLSIMFKGSIFVVILAFT